MQAARLRQEDTGPGRQETFPGEAPEGGGTDAQRAPELQLQQGGKVLRAEAQAGRQAAGIWTDYGIGVGSDCLFWAGVSLQQGNTSCIIPEPEIGEEESAGQRTTHTGKNQPKLLPGKQGTSLEVWELMLDAAQSPDPPFRKQLCISVHFQLCLLICY